MSKRPHNILHSQIELALIAWKEVCASDSPLDKAIAHFFYQNRKKVGSRDRRFLSEILFSAVRNRTYFDLWVKRLGKRNQARTFFLLCAARERLIELDFFKQEIAGLIQSNDVCEDVYEVLGKGELPPGTHFETQFETLSHVYSYPQWMIQMWLEQFGSSDCEKLIKAFHQRAPLTIRTNTLKIDRDGLIAHLKKYNLYAVKTKRSENGIFFYDRVQLLQTSGFKKGYFEIQDEGSQIICEMIGAKPGEMVWDVCAGGGGKTLALASHMNNKGRIIATDIRENKLGDLKVRAKRAGAYNIIATNRENIASIKECENGFDRVLVDAPCTGLGTLRRSPDIKWRLDETSFLSYQKRQLELLNDVCAQVKEGGHLYYVTCSVAVAENEVVFNKFLEAHPEFSKKIYPYSADGYFRLIPHEHSTDGFFMAIAEKRR